MRYSRIFLALAFSIVPSLIILTDKVRPAGDPTASASSTEIGRFAQQSTSLAPTKVHLQAKAKPLIEVIHQLSGQSKIPVYLVREPENLGGRSVTLDTGETSFR